MSYKKIHAFGLDISDYSLEIVSLNKKRKVELFLREKIPFGVVVNGKIKDKQALSEILIKLKEKAGKSLDTDNVILSLPENKIFAHVFSVPKSLVNDPKVILKLAQEHIPLDINESIFDYKVIKDKELPKKEKRIYFVAVEEKLVFDYLEVLSLAKLKPVAIDVEPSSIARALEDPKKKALQNKLVKKIKARLAKDEKQKKKKKKNPDKKDAEVKEAEAKEIEEMIKSTRPLAELALDIGAKHSVATVFYNANAFPSISIPIGGHNFSQIIQEKLKTKNFEEAQKIKTKLTLKSEKYKKIQGPFEAEQDKIIKEVKGLINYFEKNNDVIVKTLYVSGGSAKLVGFLEYIKSNLGIEVKKAVPHIEKKERFDPELYVNAVGLALRGISKDPVTAEINLLPAHQKRLLVEQQAKSAIIYSSLVVLFVSSLLIASFNIVLSNLYFDLEGLEKANTSFQKIVEGTRYQEIEEHIQELNNSAQLAKQTLAETYSIESIYKHFYANVPHAIVINQFNYNNKEGKHQIEINGFALEREQVLALQEKIKASTFYANLVAPLSNLLKQKDIYFAFNFEIDLIKFQEYLAEEKQKAEEEEAQRLKEETLNGTGGNLLHGTSPNNQNQKQGVSAFKTGDGSNSNNSDIKAFQEGDSNQKPSIIPLQENLIETEDLADLGNDIGQISDSIEEIENIEDQQIEEILKNSNQEYPFQEKIHEKVGDIFIIEQEFRPGDQTNQNTN